MSAHELLAAWHDQQRAFIEFRDLRTRCIVEVLAQLRVELGRPIRVLDLGCGPGSLANAVTEAMDDALVTGVDRDPVLLRLFRETASHPDRTTVVDATLGEDGWADGFANGSFDAAISATALHWLHPWELARLHHDLARVIAPGGLVLNADHLDFDHAAQPWIGRVAASFRSAGERRMRAEGAMGWDEWWEIALSQPGWEAEAEAWRSVWTDKGPRAHVDVDFHLSSLRAAGFTETAQIWQWLDDRIVYARRPVEEG